jgi:NADPH2:quinone reductase
LADPGLGEVLISQQAIGLNYIDVYHRTGLYPVPAMPAIIGMEGSGVVEKTGEGVTEFSPGATAYSRRPACETARWHQP